MTKETDCKRDGFDDWIKVTKTGQNAAKFINHMCLEEQRKMLRQAYEAGFDAGTGFGWNQCTFERTKDRKLRDWANQDESPRDS